MEPSGDGTQKQDGEVGQLFRLRVLLEPKGFIRIIEFVLAVFAFATTAGYSSYMGYRVLCSGIYHNDIIYSFHYPFNLKDFDMLCVVSNATGGLTPGQPVGKAQFFVAIGVLAMLYCILSLIWYVFLEVKFFHFDLIPLADLVLTAGFALFFFLASCAWASGVSTVKYWTSFDNVVKEFYSGICSAPKTTCTADVAAGYASLNISVIFGFLNLAVWGANCWFVYKETSFFKARQPTPPLPKEPQQELPPNDV